MCSVGFLLFDLYLPDKKFFYDFVEEFHKRALCLHMIEVVSKKHKPDSFSMEIYNKVNEYKTVQVASTFLLFGMKMCGAVDEKLLELTRHVVGKIGHLLQAEVFCY